MLVSSVQPREEWITQIQHLLEADDLAQQVTAGHEGLDRPGGIAIL